MCHIMQCFEKEIENSFKSYRRDRQDVAETLWTWIEIYDG